MGFKDKLTTQAFVKFLKSVPSDEDEQANVPLAENTIVAFRNEYVDPRKVVDDFIDYVNDCHAEYQRNAPKYNAPYISLCQSSGYGKSRLLQQVAQKRKLLYVCVGDSKSSFPAPNVKARNFLFLQDRTDEPQRQRHLQQQLERCVSWCLQNDFTDTDQFGATPAAFWDDIINHEIATFKQKWEQRDAIWIVLDEARSLLSDSDGRPSDFRILRRALREVSGKVRNRIFVILVDTKSAISNFSPSRTVDASARPDPDKSSADRYLFHPYILLLTHDTLKSAEVDFTDEWSFVSCGRPLWKSLYPDPSTSYVDLYDFAANKLRKSPKEIVDDELALLAIVICRTGVYLSPQSSLASDLASNYMATLLLSDCEHEHFLVTYMSDPVLSVVSARLWYENDLLVKRGLPLLRQKMLHGAVLEGYLGELVGRMILLIGIDKSTNGGSYDGKWCKVSSFMENCFGITDCLVGEEAYMGFSHFIPYTQQPKTYQDLKDMLYRRGACCLPRGFKGIDLLIPFWKRTDKEPLISYISIQIKNKVESENDTDVRNKMNPQTCFGADSELREPLTDIILIIMQVGLTYKMYPPRSSRVTDNSEEALGGPQAGVEVPQAGVANLQVNQTECDFLPDDKWKKWVYTMRGITPNSYPFLQNQKELMEELIRLAKGSLDLQEWMTCDEILNKPPTSPGMARRREHISKIVP